MLITKCLLLLLVAGSLWNLAATDELFVYLTQQNGAYKLHYTKGSNDLWKTIDVPTEIKMIQDVEFNYATQNFHFTSIQPLQKGIWKANMTLEDYELTHQLRDDSSPLKLTIYPEYDLALFYDQGYSLVIEITLQTENDDLRIRSLFQAADALDGIYFLDRKSNLVYAQPNDARGILFSTSLNGSLLSSFPFQPRGGKNANITAYDNDNGIIYYCANGYLNAMRMSDSMFFPPSVKLACTPMAADNGMIYYTNAQLGFIQKISFGPGGVTQISDKFLKLPFPVSMTTNIISFKHYTYTPDGQRYCASVECDQICLPVNNAAGASCQCMDYYTLAKDNNSAKNADSPCEKDTLARPGVFYAIYNASFAQDATLFYRLDGDPAIWTRRPQREQLFTISSDVAAVAIDWNGQRMFAAALRFREIMSANLNGSFSTSGHYSGISPSVKSIAYDWVGNNLVWFDPVFRWLRMVPLWTSAGSTETRFKTSMLSANLAGYALRLDAVAGYLFFLEFEDSASLISLWRSLMDGSEAKKLYTFPDNVFSDSIDTDPDITLPGALSIDFFYKTVWVAFTNDIFVLSYEGIPVYSTRTLSPDHNIYNSRVASLSLFNVTYALVVVKRIDTNLATLYAYAIVRKTDGTCCNSLVNTYSKVIYGEYRALTNFEEQPKPPVTMNCTALKCLYMCTNIKGTATCICPDDFSWDSTAGRCILKTNDQLSTPAVVFTAIDRICYRNLIDYTGWSGKSSFTGYDNCSALGFASGPMDSPRSVNVDPLTFNAYVLQLLSNPRTTFKVDLMTAQKRAYSYSFASLLGQLAFNLNASLSQTSNILYSAVLPNFTAQSALAFDWLGRNLYVADAANGRLLVVRDDFANPLVLVFNVNFTSLTIDVMRRKLYWSTGTGKGSVIVQRDLNADSFTECVVARLDEEVIGMDISYYNQTLLFLTQPSNQIGRILLRRLPPFASCPSTLPAIQYNSLAKSNVTHFSVYRSVTFFTCGAADCEQMIYSSTDLGQTTDDQESVFGTNLHAKLSSLAVFDPHLMAMASNQSTFAAKDPCSSMARGQCDQFCLSSWPINGNKTNVNCFCSDGMVLLGDGRTCAARYLDISKDGIIFSPDDYRHSIFAVPLTALNNQKASIRDSLSTYAVHSKSRPYAVAFDYISGYVYYSDFDRGDIYRFNPNKQMQANAGSRNASSELFLDLPSDSRVYGLLVDPVSRTLFFTIRDNSTLYAADLVTKKMAVIKQFPGNIFGVTMDRRAERMHLYVSLRNTTRVVQVSSMNTTSGNNRIIVVARASPFTWSSIVRISPDGSNYAVVCNYTASGPEVQTVPWIYDMGLDYNSNRLFYSTGQNRSIMYQNIIDLPSSAQVFASSPENNNSFIYGLQISGDYVLATDWGLGGIHVYNKNTGQKVNVLAPQYLIGVNGLTIYSPSVENSFQSVNTACSGDERVCSHVCVPLANNQRKCICPDGADTVDGVNCPGVPRCLKPSTALGTLDSKCSFRNGSIACTLTCSTNNPALDPGVRGVSYTIACTSTSGTQVQWCTDLSNLCRNTNATGIDYNAVNKCVKQAEALAAVAASAGNSDASGLSSGGIAGIIIACILVAAVLAVLGFFGWRRYHPVIIEHIRVYIPSIGSTGGSGLPHMEDLSVPESFRYRNLQETSVPS